MLVFVVFVRHCVFCSDYIDSFLYRIYTCVVDFGLEVCFSQGYYNLFALVSLGILWFGLVVLIVGPGVLIGLLVELLSQCFTDWFKNLLGRY
eukprot:gene3136-2118_t